MEAVSKSPQSLTAEEVQDFEKIMGEFLVKSEARWAALADKGGNLFAQMGDTAGLNLGVLSALGAGSFAATHEMAKRLGEKDFSTLYHEGQELSVLMSSLEYECLLITVFDKNTNVGLVRLCAQEATEPLNVGLRQASEKSEGI